MLIVTFLSLLFLNIIIDITDTALLSIDLLEKNSKNEYIIEYIKKNTMSILITILIFTNIVQFAMSFVLTKIISNGNYNSLTISILSCFFGLFLVYLSIVAKVFAMVKFKFCSKLTMYPIYLLSRILYPIVHILQKISEANLRIFGISKEDQDELEKYRIELRNTLSSNKKLRNKMEEIDMMQYTLDMRSITIEKVMTYRSEFIDIPYESNIEKICQDLIKLPQKKYIVVFKSNNDEIIGTIDVMFFFRFYLENKQTSIKDCITPPTYFLNTTSVYDLLQFFKRTKNKIVFIINEYGSIVGIVTITDLLKEIIGDSEDDEKEIEKINDFTFKVDGICSIRTINRELCLDLPDNYITISNLIINHIHNIPKENSVIKYNNVSFTILKNLPNRIEELLIILPNQNQLVLNTQLK